MANITREEQNILSGGSTSGDDSGSDSLSEEEIQKKIEETDRAIREGTPGHGLGGGPGGQTSNRGGAGGASGSGSTINFGGGGSSGGSSGGSTQTEQKADGQSGAEKQQELPDDLQGSNDPRFRSDLFSSPQQQEQFRAEFEQDLRQQFDNPGIEIRAGEVDFEQTGSGRFRGRVNRNSLTGMGRGATAGTVSNVEEAGADAGVPASVVRQAKQFESEILADNPGLTESDVSITFDREAGQFRSGLTDAGEKEMGRRLDNSIGRLTDSIRRQESPESEDVDFEKRQNAIDRLTDSIRRQSEVSAEAAATQPERLGDFDFKIPERAFGIDLPGGGREPEEILRGKLKSIDEEFTKPAQDFIGPIAGDVGGAIAGEAAEHEDLTPLVAESVARSTARFVPGAGSFSRAAGEVLADLEREEAEVLGRQIGEGEARGGVQGAVDIAKFPLSAPVTTQELTELGVEGVEETQAGRGEEFVERVGEVSIEAAKQFKTTVEEKPFETAGAFGSSLAVSGGAIGAASRVSPTVGRAVSVGIQPGEEAAIAVGRRIPAVRSAATRLPGTGVREGHFGGRDRGQLDLTFGGGRRRRQKISKSDIADIKATADLDESRFLPGGRMGQRSPDPVAAGRTETGEFVGSFTRQQDPAFGGTGKPNVGKTRDFSNVLEGPEFEFGPRRVQEPELDPLGVRALKQTRRADPAVLDTETAAALDEAGSYSPELDAFEDPTIGTEPAGSTTGLGETTLLDADMATGAMVDAELSVDVAQRDVVTPELDLMTDSIGRAETRVDLSADTRSDSLTREMLEPRFEVPGDPRFEPPRTEIRSETFLFEPKEGGTRIEPRAEAPPIELLFEPETSHRRDDKRKRHRFNFDDGLFTRTRKFDVVEDPGAAVDAELDRIGDETDDLFADL